MPQRLVHAPPVEIHVPVDRMIPAMNAKASPSDGVQSNAPRSSSVRPSRGMSEA
jgi:hypothetical protein